MPGNIRKADHFVTFLKRVVEYLKSRIRVQRVEAEKPLAFLHHLHRELGMAKKDMKRCYERLNSLLKTLEITDLDRFVPIIEVADFTTLVATYDQGFMVLIEPFNPQLPNIPDPVLQVRLFVDAIWLRALLP